MITYKNGDLLKSDCDIICHQVNLQGVMGGGLAFQIARDYPECEKAYKEYVKKHGKNAFGTVFIVAFTSKKKERIIIANCFTQSLNFDTNYSQVCKCFNEVKEFAKKEKLSVGIPYKYGCGIANGDCNIVEQIIKDVFLNTEIDCQIWKLD